MGKQNDIVLYLFLSEFFGTGVWAPAQKFASGHIVLHRTVDLVQLDVAVMDKKGNYVSGLRPWNFAVYEDGIQEKLATFGEQNQDESMTSSPARLSSGVGRSVFILFDTSNYMYRGFVFAQDAIAEFVRSLDRSDRVAFYSYSRDFSRGALLTSDRMAVLRGVRATVAGDDA